MSVGVSKPSTHSEMLGMCPNDDICPITSKSSSQSSSLLNTSFSLREYWTVVTSLNLRKIDFAVESWTGKSVTNASQTSLSMGLRIWFERFLKIPSFLSEVPQIFFYSIILPRPNHKSIKTNSTFTAQLITILVCSPSTFPGTTRLILFYSVFS
jgi:hypothetical protein